jgi:hypothetical protein
MRFTLDLTPAELAELLSRLLFENITQEIETMSGTLSDQLAAAQDSVETALNDISAKVDAALAARPVDGTVITQDTVDRANRIATLATAISTRLDGVATDPTATPAA